MIVSPYQFVGDFSVEGTPITYVETRELGQGGPTLGNIIIGDSPVLRYKNTAEFGGPFLIKNGHIYAPLLNRFKFLLTMIHIKSKNIVSVSNTEEDIVLIRNINDNTVFYFNDLSNQNLKSYTF
jgi:hypothetical protein